MAYLKKQDLVVLGKGTERTTAIVTDIEFRRFKKFYKDKKTGEKRFKLKAVPYAICTVMVSHHHKYNTGDNLLIAGYKLRNHVFKGDKCLMLENQYIAEFEKDGEKWVIEMIKKNKEKKNAKNSK